VLATDIDAEVLAGNDSTSPF